MKFICIFEPTIYAEEHRSKVDKLGLLNLCLIRYRLKFCGVKILTIKLIRGKVHVSLSARKRTSELKHKKSSLNKLLFLYPKVKNMILNGESTKY